MSFVQGLKEIWRERKARNFSIFVFLSMTAYFMQELILIVVRQLRLKELEVKFIPMLLPQFYLH